MAQSVPKSTIKIRRRRDLVKHDGAKKRMEDQPNALRARDIVFRLQSLITEYGNLPVTFGDKGRHVRDVQVLEKFNEESSESAEEFVILGW